MLSVVRYFSYSVLPSPFFYILLWKVILNGQKRTTIMRFKILVVFALLLVCLGVKAQRTVENDTVYEKATNIPDVMPSYPGGSQVLLKYLQTQIRYPSDARKMKVEGRVVVSFVVDKDGWVTNVSVLKGVFPSLDREAVRVVSGMARWNPGMQNGKPVKVKYSLPISFRL